LAHRKAVNLPTGNSAQQHIVNHALKYPIQANAIKVYLQEVDYQSLLASLSDELQQKRKMLTSVSLKNYFLSFIHHQIHRT